MIIDTHGAPDFEYTYIKVNNLQFHAVQAGPRGGPLVLLLHGFPEFWYGWRKQIGPLAEAGYRVLVPDQRGYNLSEKPKGVLAYSINILAQDVIGLISALGEQKATVIGHDWGAAVAWHVAQHHPERLEKLSILNVPHPEVMLRTLQKSFEQILKSWYIFSFQIPRLPEWVLRRKNFSIMRRMLLSSSKPGSFSPAELEIYVKAWSRPGALTAMLNWYRAIFRIGIQSLRKAGDGPFGGRIQVPTLMLWGAHDVALSRRMAQPSIDQCDAGKLVFFKGATHWVQHDEPEGVNAHLIDFLTNGL